MSNTTQYQSYWDSTNPILADGDIGTVRETGEQKIGDGTSKWSQLSYSVNMIKSVYDPNNVESDAFDADNISSGTTYVQVTPAEKSTWNGKQDVVKSVYTAFLTQAGTNAPVPTPLKDDLSTAVWAYSAVGIYTLTKAGAFTVDKTVPTKLESYVDNDGNKYTLERTSADVMTLKTYASADITTLANGVLLNQLVNIEVYL